MSGTEQFHYQFLHNVFGCFIENTLEYFGDYFYPRYQHKIVGTYDKAVQYIVNQEKLGREVDKPNLPALILNPGDFGLDDANAGGKQFWRFPHLAPGLANKIFEPIYFDGNVEITIAFTRLKGEIELLSLLPSFYEYFDLKLFIIQMFGGEGRYIQPMYFNDFIILPPELVNFKYNNSITKESYVLDWKNNGAYEFLAETTNKNELVVPGKIKPRYVLRGLTDGSTRYGGTDDIADWKLSAMVEYEIEIPSYLILRTDTIFDNVNFNIGYGSTYSKYPEYNVPTSEITIDIYTDSNYQSGKNALFDEKSGEFVYNLSINENTNSLTNPNLLNPEDFNSDGTVNNEVLGISGNIYGLGTEASESVSFCDGDKFKREVVFKTRYFHQITEEEQNSTEDIIIEIPEKIYDTSLIKIISKDGLMEYGLHYIIENTCNKIRIYVNKVILKSGEFIEIFIYETPVGTKAPIFLFGGSALISTTKESPIRTILEVKFAFRSTSKATTKFTGIMQ